MCATVIIYSSDTRRKNKIISLTRSIGLNVIGDAVDAPQALRLVHATQPDLVIIDINIDHQEIEVAAVIADKKIAPVIIITAPQQQNILDTLNREYLITYVVKPINKWAFEAAIHMTLAGFRKLREMEKEIEKLKETLETRKLVERAKHIIMQDHNLTEQAAFRRLQKQSMDRGIPMKEIAEAIILSDNLKNPG